MSIDIAAGYRGWLAELFAHTAEWRAFKAEEWPDDRRNRRSSDALAAAEAYTRALPPDHPVLSNLAALQMQLGETRGPEEVLSTSSHAASRFCFDNAAVDPGPREFDDLLAAVFYETLESWRDVVVERDMQPAASLVAFFEEHGAPLENYEEDDEDDEPSFADVLRPKVETIVLEGGRQLAILDVPVWPPTGATIQLGDPNRDVVVRDVRMLLTGAHASVVVDVERAEP